MVSLYVYRMSKYARASIHPSVLRVMQDRLARAHLCSVLGLGLGFRVKTDLRVRVRVSGEDRLAC